MSRFYASLGSNKICKNKKKKFSLWKKKQFEKGIQQRISLKKWKVIDNADQQKIVNCVKGCSLDERLKKGPLPKIIKKNLSLTLKGNFELKTTWSFRQSFERMAKVSLMFTSMTMICSMCNSKRSIF